MSVKVSQSIVPGTSSTSKVGRTLDDSLDGVLKNLHYTDEILNSLDPLRMWTTLIRMTDGGDGRRALCFPQLHGGINRASQEATTTQDEPYDPRLILHCLMELVKPSNSHRLDSRLFVTQNCLSFAFAATSLRNEELRSLGYAVLTRFYRHLSSTSMRSRDEQPQTKVKNGKKEGRTGSDKFRERFLYAFAIRLLKESVTERNQRLRHVVAHFFARISKLMLCPGDACFSPLMAFLALKPRMSLDTVPEFFKLFHSSSTENHKVERQWMLKLCSEAILEPSDYQMLCKVYTIESCMALFTSTIADLKSKFLVLRLFERCVSMPSSARDLHRRLNFATWLVQAIEYHRTTELEELKLAKIFVTLVDNVYGEVEGEPDAKRRKKEPTEGNGGVDIDKLALCVNRKRILTRLKKLDSSEEQRHQCIKQLKRLKKRLRLVPAEN